MNKGRLYLIPCPISEENINWLGSEIPEVIFKLKHYVVERAKTARRFIKLMQPNIIIQELLIEEFDKEDASKNLNTLLKPLLDGHDMGLMSEAGNPCIADPGHLFVRLAHEQGIEVIPLVGPSSILMALIASGFNGQSFCFNGYLPNKKETLIPRLKSLEQSAQRFNQTQIFMETPYRNEFIIEVILSALQPNTNLCIAANIGSPAQSILTQTVQQWKKHDLKPYHKVPCVYLIG